MKNIDESLQSHDAFYDTIEGSNYIGYFKNSRQKCDMTYEGPYLNFDEYLASETYFVLDNVDRYDIFIESEQARWLDSKTDTFTRRGYEFTHAGEKTVCIKLGYLRFPKIDLDLIRQECLQKVYVREDPSRTEHNFYDPLIKLVESDKLWPRYDQLTRREKELKFPRTFADLAGDFNCYPGKVFVPPQWR
jgi:hypothetical protein